MAPVELGSKPSPERFGKWAKTHEIFLHPDAAFLVPTKSMGMGAFAKRPIAAGTTLLSCPVEASISPYAEPTPLMPSVAALREEEEQEKREKRDEVLHVVMRLLAELCRNSTPMQAWLEACPQMPHHLFSLSAEQEKVLLPTSTSSSPSSSSTPYTITTGLTQALQDIRVEERWARAQQIISRHPSIWPSHLATRERFVSCLTQVFSRNFHREEIVGREGPYLLPGLDILNHSNDRTNASFKVQGGGRKHAAAFTVVAARPLARGEQIYCSYGHIGAARFAVEFQFVTDAVVEEDVVRISAPCLVALGIAARTAAIGDGGAELNTEVIAADLAQRVERLQRLGILFDEGLHLSRPPTSGGASTLSEEAQRAREVEVEEQLRLLRATCYLLSVPEPLFTDLYHSIARHWEAPKTEEVRQATMTMLGLRREATQAQLQQVEMVFVAEDADSVEGIRRQLCVKVLQSEMSILAASEQRLS